MIFLRLIGHCGCPRFAGGCWDTVKGEGVEDVSREGVWVGGGVDVHSDEKGAGHGESYLMAVQMTRLSAIQNDPH